MCKALWMMKGRSGKKTFTSRLYQNISSQCRQEASLHAKKMWSDPEMKHSLVRKKIGRKNTTETRLLMSESAKRRHREKPISSDIRTKIADSLRGRVMSEEEKNRKSASASRAPKPKVKCPHCSIVGGKPIMMRYHFDNCRSKT
jgi:hypothetical protein